MREWSLIRKDSERDKLRYLSGWIQIIVLLVGFKGFANQSIVYHGRILHADGTSLESSQVALRVQIRSPGSEDCLFYEETKTIDMSGSDGIFSFALNGGQGTRTDNTGLSLSQIMSNRAAFSFSNNECASGSSYTPQSSDVRKFSFAFKEQGQSTWETVASEEIQFSPLAMEALQVGGYSANNLCRIVDGSNSPVSVSPLTQTMWTKLQSLLTGTVLSVSNTSAALELNSTNSGFLMPRLSTAQRDAIASPSTGLQVYNSSTNQLNYYDGSAWQSVGAAGSGISSLGGLTGSSQSFANDTNVTMSSATNTHTLGWTGQLSLARGGTASNLTAVNGGAVYSTGTALAITAAGTSGQVLTSNGAAAPTWQSLNDPTKVAKAGDSMTGLLVLSADPSAALGAATKQYVDTGLSGKQSSLGYTPVNKAGDTMTGVLNLASNGLSIGSTQFVFDTGRIGIGTSTPFTFLDIRGFTRIQDDSNATYTATSNAISAPSGAGASFTNSWSLDSNSTGIQLVVKNANSNTQTGFIHTVSTAGAGYAPTLVFGSSTGASAYSERMRIDPNGNLIVGTDPGSGTATKLYVGGQIASKPYDAGNSCSIDWSNGNTQKTTCDCSSSLSFANLRNGGNYTLLVTDTGTTQCNISSTTTGDDALGGTLTSKWSPANGVRTSSSYTVYSMTRIDSVLLIAWQAFN